MPAGRPRVFQPGTLTVVFGPDGQAVYAGATLLTMAEKVVVGRDGRPLVTFAGPGKDDGTLLEEESRAAESVVRGISRG